MTLGTLLRGGVLALAGLGAAFAARAAEPVAIVEAVEGVPGLEPMTMLPAGRVIALGAGGHVEIGYLRSCWRETIDGGKISIGEERSEVEGGRVMRELVECDATPLALSAEQAAESGVTVFRRVEPEGAAAPAMTIFGLAPAVLMPEGAAALTIERLDAGEPVRHFDASARLLDLAAHGAALSPGGRYRFSAEGASVEVIIDPLAAPGAAPLIGRLVRFER